MNGISFTWSFTYLVYTSLEEVLISVVIGFDLEETHPRLFKSLQTILESIHSTYLHSMCTDPCPSVDKSLGEKVPSHFQFGSVWSASNHDL